MKGNFEFERRISFICGLMVVGTVLFLAIRNEPFADPNIVVLFRIVLALAVGIVGGTIPGFLSVSYSVGGMAMRAGGALALFIVTFFWTPTVLNSLKAAEVKIDALPQIDVRTAAGWEKKYEERLKAKVLVKIPVTLRNVAQPAFNAFLNGATADLSLDQAHFKFHWYKFATTSIERRGVWLGIDSDVSALSVPSGQTVFKEIYFEPDEMLSWQDFLVKFQSATSDRMIAVFAFDIDGKIQETRCQTDLAYWKGAVLSSVAKSNRQPMAVVMSCVA